MIVEGRITVVREASEKRLSENSIKLFEAKLPCKFKLKS
jgi:hypothetical protein